MFGDMTFIATIEYVFIQGTELPPCRVCGEKASGLHYGVYTCEACKVNMNYGGMFV